MIHLFRKIRKKLLTENKFSKYLIYAIGEITLVIIGILIALTINNNNEIRKNENRFLNNLSQIRDELKLNIENTKKGIFFYQKLDSLFGSVMSDTLEIEDFKTPEGYYLTNILFKGEQTVIFKRSFNNLNKSVDDLPENYNAIIRKLDKVYSEHGMELVRWNEIVMNMIHENETKIGEEQKWFSSYLWYDEPNDQAIKFFLNDPYYKNQIAYYYKNSRNHLERIKIFRVAALNAFEEITKFLELNSEIELDKRQYSINEDELICFVGKYRLDNEIEVEIILEDDKLKWLQNSFKEELHTISSNSFFIMDNEAIIEFDQSSNCDSNYFIWKVLGREYKFSK